MSIADDAWARFHLQHQDKPVLEGFVRSFYGPLDQLALSVLQLSQLRGVNTARGAQLDGVGQIVGLGRKIPQGLYIAFFGFETQPAGRAFGVARMRRRSDPWADTLTLPDDDYRRLLKAKILLNNAAGLSEDIVEAIKLIFRVDRAYVENTGPASVKLHIGRLLDPGDATWELFSGLLPVASGVSVTPNYWDSRVSAFPPGFPSAS